MKDNKKVVKDSKEIIGASFEDMTISEMVEVQGAGDIEAETTTPVCAIAVTASFSIQIVKSIKGSC